MQCKSYFGKLQKYVKYLQGNVSFIRSKKGTHCEVHARCKHAKAVHNLWLCKNGSIVAKVTLPFHVHTKGELCSLLFKKLRAAKRVGRAALGEIKNSFNCLLL